jgi:hypothetical protein
MDKLSRFDLRGGGILNFEEVMRSLYEAEDFETINFEFSPNKKFDKNILKILRIILRNKSRKDFENDEEDDEEDNEYNEMFTRALINYLLTLVKNVDKVYKSMLEFTKKGYNPTKHIEKIQDLHRGIVYTDRKRRDSEHYIVERIKTGYGEKLKQRVTNMKYESPIFINDQWTYQRVFIENDREVTVYDLTMKASKTNGMGIEIEYDEKFGTKYVKSIDGIRDGEGGKYWEYWIINKDTGEERIGKVAVDQQTLRKNEFIEWRLAEERDTGCGGGGGQGFEKKFDPFANKALDFAIYKDFRILPKALGIRNMRTAY